MTTGQLNNYLERANAIAGTLDIYLMRADGTTVASSNWYKESSFINKNFSFRPYYQQAMQGRLGRYYALGTTSNERGYYFASAVRDEPGGKVIGVVTVKISVGEVEGLWKHEPVEFLVTDPDGVVFMASQERWRYHTLSTLPEQRKTEIRRSLRYLDKPLDTLPDFRLEYDQGAAQVWLEGKHYLLTLHPMLTEGWDVQVLSDWQSADRALNMALTLATVLLGLSGLLVFLLWKYQSQRRRYEHAALEALESKVEERTRELRLAQEELIQAAKMAALGQLSAAINHELNNPLGAIRAYADNAAQFLALGRTDMARSNLEEISGLTERMAAITRQLKTFSRKSAGRVENCPLATALDSALLIVQPRLSQTTIRLHQQRDPQLLEVRADLVWLEQILVNLLSNALEAVAEQGDGEIRLITRRDNGQALIQVRDNGPGISASDLPHVFEAFFTTKSIGKGLGLGLSISYRLAKDMQGDLQAGNAPEGGAVFTLLLPLATTQLTPADAGDKP
ncbi:MAG: ATP-binding protein [Thiolinea sp.]